MRWLLAHRRHLKGWTTTSCKPGIPRAWTCPACSVSKRSCSSPRWCSGSAGLHRCRAGPGGALARFFLPDYWLVTQRETAPGDHPATTPLDTIDQLTLVVEAGLGFDAALQRVASTNDGPWPSSCSARSDDMRAGMPRDQALRAFADRTKLPDIRQLVTALIQAQKHGVTIAETSAAPELPSFGTSGCSASKRRRRSWPPR